MSWIKVCKTSEVEPGSIKKLWASVGGGIPLVVAHHKAGFTALPPICPHMEEPLDESGTILGCKLTCTKHLWSWDLETLELQDEAELPLKTYDTKVDGENVMVYVTEQLEYDFDEEDDIDDDEFFGDDDDDDFDQVNFKPVLIRKQCQIRINDIAHQFLQLKQMIVYVAQKSNSYMFCVAVQINMTFLEVS